MLDGIAPGSCEALDGIAFVAQDTPLYKYLSVVDTLRLVSSLANTWDEGRARARLDALGVPLRRKVGKLSGASRPRSPWLSRWPATQGCSSWTSRSPSSTRWPATTSCPP